MPLDTPVHLPRGRLQIDWRLEQTDGCELLRREHDGPPVSALRRGGFGTELIKNAFEYDLRGVLDYNLSVQSGEAIAGPLRGRGIPFVFATGYGDRVTIPERLRGVPVVPKPVEAAAIAAKIAQARAARP